MTDRVSKLRTSGIRNQQFVPANSEFLTLGKWKKDAILLQSPVMREMQSRMILFVIRMLSVCVLYYRVDVISVIVSFVEYCIGF